MSRAGRLLIAAVAAAAAGCCPKAEVIRLPGPVEYRERLVYVPIPSELTEQHEIATGPLSECPQVAAKRKAELQACNADKRATRELAGEER